MRSKEGLKASLLRADSRGARGRFWAIYIAEDLVLSENTVWAHIKRIYSKTGVHTKQELMSIVEKMAEGKE